MRHVRLSPSAERDLEAIDDWIAADDPVAARRVLDEIEAACRLLAEHPRIGRHRDEIAPGVLSFPVGRYVLFYRPEPDGIGVARILHGSRDLPAAYDAGE